MFLYCIICTAQDTGYCYTQSKVVGLCVCWPFASPAKMEMPFLG